MRVRFYNNEFPEVALDFTFVSDKGKIYRYHLEPGKVYNLPKEVVDHLNSLSYPRYKLYEDKETGQVYSKQVGERKRFTLVPEESKT